MSKPSNTSRANAAAGGDLPWDSPTPPSAPDTPRRRVLGRDPLSLRIQVEALLLDPRGKFRPRAVQLQELAGERRDARLVMQVGEHADGSFSVVTPEPLVPGECFRVWVDPPRDDDDPLAAGAQYMVTGCRPGNRPEDGSQGCWVSVLQPEPEIASGRARGPADPARGA